MNIPTWYLAYLYISQGLEGDVSTWPREWTWGNHDNPDAAHEYRTAVLPCEKTSLLSEKGKPIHEVMDEYATDHDVWIDDFLDAWPRMQSNGYGSGELKDGPESSWLGFASLQGIILPYQFYLSALTLM